MSCPESHPFSAPPEDFFENGNLVPGLKCCQSETGEGCEWHCQGTRLDDQYYEDHNTCEDHPSAVRKPGKVY